MFVVSLTPKGASYTAEAETFLSAQGLPIADIAVSPKDGAMYFLIGGRATQSGIYRVTYQGNENTAPSKPQRLDKVTVAAQKSRRELEAFHGGPNPKAMTKLWPQLAQEDRAIRSAAHEQVDVLQRRARTHATDGVFERVADESIRHADRNAEQEEKQHRPALPTPNKNSRRKNADGN